MKKEDLKAGMRVIVQIFDAYKIVTLTPTHCKNSIFSDIDYSVYAVDDNHNGFDNCWIPIDKIICEAQDGIYRLSFTEEQIPKFAKKSPAKKVFEPTYGMTILVKVDTYNYQLGEIIDTIRESGLFLFRSDMLGPRRWIGISDIVGEAIQSNDFGRFLNFHEIEGYLKEKEIKKEKEGITPSLYNCLIKDIIEYFDLDDPTKDQRHVCQCPTCREKLVIKKKIIENIEVLRQK